MGDRIPIIISIQRAAQTVLGVYLKRTVKLAAPNSEVWFYSRSDGYRKPIRRSHKVILFLYDSMDNYDADLEASDTCVRSSLLSGVEYLFVRLLVHPEHCDTIRDAILTCARKPTRVSLIYRTHYGFLTSMRYTNPRSRAYSKRVPRTNCALRIKKCAPRISSGNYFLSTS